MSIRGFLSLVTPSAFGLLIGYLLGGRLDGFRRITVTAIWLVWLAVLAQASQYYLVDLRQFIEQRLRVPMFAIVFALVLSWLAINLPRWPAAIRTAGVAIALGATLNGIAIAANGRMPYDAAAAAAAGSQTGLITPKNEPAHADTRLRYLGDIIPVRLLHQVISIGDIMIGGGTASLVVVAMRRGGRRSEDPRRDGDK